MGTPIVKGLSEVHHCATYSPPRPIYGLCRVGQPLRPTLQCDLLSGNYGYSLNINNQGVLAHSLQTCISNSPFKQKSSF